MGFNIKEHVLPPGTLIKFENAYNNQQLSFSFHSIGIVPGTIAMIVEHLAPFYIILLIDDTVRHISCHSMVDIHGWIAEFTPIYCGSGFYSYPSW